MEKEEDQPPPLPRRPVTILRPAPSIPGAVTAHQNGARPSSVIPSRPAPPLPTPKLPPRPTSPTQPNSKAKSQSGQADDSKEMKSQSSVSKSDSSSSTRRKLEITIVDARPMSEIGFRDLKKTPTSSHTLHQSKPPTSPLQASSVSPSAFPESNVDTKETTPSKTSPPLTPSRLTVSPMTSQDAGTSHDQKRDSSSASHEDEQSSSTTEAFIKPKSKQPTIIRPQSKLLRQQAMASQDSAHPDSVEDAKTIPSYPPPPLPTLPPSASAHKLPPLPSRGPMTPSTILSPMPTSPPPASTPAPVCHPPPQKSDPKILSPVSRPPPPKPVTAPISKEGTLFPKLSANTPSTQVPPPKLGCQPMKISAPASRPPPPKPEAPPVDQQQQKQPKAAPRPRPRSTFIPATTNILTVPETTAATTDDILSANENSNSSLENKDVECKSHFQGNESSTMRLKRPVIIIRPQSMLLPSKISNGGAVSSSSHDKFSSSPSSRERPSRPSAPPVKEDSIPSSVVTDNETENVYETIDNVHSESNSNLTKTSTNEIPVLPPPRKDADENKNISCPRSSIHIQTDNAADEDNVPVYSQINKKVKSNSSMNNHSKLSHPDCRSNVNLIPTSTLSQNEASISSIAMNEDEEEKGRGPPKPSPPPPKPKPKPKPKPSVKPKPLRKTSASTIANTTHLKQEAASNMMHSPCGLRESKEQNTASALSAVSDKHELNNTVGDINIEKNADSDGSLSASAFILHLNSEAKEYNSGTGSDASYPADQIKESSDFEENEATCADKLKSQPPPISKRPVTIIGRKSLQEKEDHVSSLGSNTNNSRSVSVDSKSDSSEFTEVCSPKRPFTVIGKPSLEENFNKDKVSDNTLSLKMDDGSQKSTKEVAKFASLPPKRPPSIVGRASREKQNILNKETTKSHSLDDTSQALSSNESSQNSSVPPKRPVTIIGLPRRSSQTTGDKVDKVDHHEDSPDKLMRGNLPTKNLEEKLPTEKSSLPKSSRPPQVLRPPPPPPAAPQSKTLPPKSENVQNEDVISESQESFDSCVVENKEKPAQHRRPPPRPSGGPSSQRQSLPPVSSKEQCDEIGNRQTISTPPSGRETIGNEAQENLDEQMMTSTEKCSPPKPRRHPQVSRPPPPPPAAPQSKTLPPKSENIQNEDVISEPQESFDSCIVENKEKPAQHRCPPPRPSGGPSCQRQSLPPVTSREQCGEIVDSQTVSAPPKMKMKDAKCNKEKGGLPSLPPRPSPGHTLYHYVANEPHGIASHDYSASQSDELSFKAGDVVLIIREVDEDWLCGNVGGQEGIFPRAFVHLKYDSNQESFGTEDDEDNSLENDKPDNSTGPRCRARFDFEGDGEGELAIEDGDVIGLISHMGSEWMRGELNGRVGIFPSAFVEIIEDISQDVKEELTDSCSINIVAMFDFDGQDGELSFQAGDSVVIQSQVNSEWLFGECGGRTGKFPASFVSHIPPSLPHYQEPEKRADNEKKTGNEVLHVEKKIMDESESSLGGKMAIAYCTAIHDYNSGTEGDLVFKSGDKIQVLEFVGEDWLEGCCSGERGLFPATYISMEKENIDVLTDNFEGEVTPPQQAVALHDFDGETDEDLTFKAGDVIEMLDFVDDSHEWRWGMFHEKKGIFPCAFVESC